MSKDVQKTVNETEKKNRRYTSASSGKSLGLSFLTTLLPIDFTLGGCIPEDPRKCCVECQVVLDEIVLRKLKTAIPRRGQAMGTFWTGTAPV